ncbi:phage holin family protein, partial [Pseudomonas sp. FW305-3-2-15-E-TSA2]
DKDGARGWGLVRRLALRSGACIVCGVSAMMLMIGGGMSIWTAGSLGCLTAMSGADVAIGLYERWAIKRLGIH